jgi:hypothetical protein
MALRLRRLQATGLASPIHSNLADWWAGAIERYLAGECPSLDAALSLRAGPGRRRKAATAAELKIGRRILAIGVGGASWKDIADALSWERDESSLRELWARIRPDVVKSFESDLDSKRRRKGSK